MSDVISDVLAAADLLGIDISSYGFDLADECENQNSNVISDSHNGETQEYFEFGSVKLEPRDSSDELIGGTPVSDIEIQSKNKKNIEKSLLTVDQRREKRKQRRVNKKKKIRDLKKLLIENPHDEIQVEQSKLALLINSEKSRLKNKIKRLRRANCIEPGEILDTSSQKMKKTAKEKKKIECVDCSDEFTSLYLMSHHRWYTHYFDLHHKRTKTLVKCSICPAEVLEDQFELHLLITHRKKKLMVPCKVCGKPFNEFNDFFSHITQHYKPIQPPTRPLHFHPAGSDPQPQPPPPPAPPLPPPDRLLYPVIPPPRFLYPQPPPISLPPCLPPSDTSAEQRLPPLLSASLRYSPLFQQQNQRLKMKVRPPVDMEENNIISSSAPIFGKSLKKKISFKEYTERQRRLSATPTIFCEPSANC